MTQRAEGEGDGIPWKEIKYPNTLVALTLIILFLFK